MKTLSGRLRAATATVARVRMLTSSETAMTVYKALFESHLRYRILAYLSAAASDLTSIVTLQNAAVRRIMRASPRESVDPL